MKKALVCFLTLILVHVICACRVSVPKNQTVELVYKDPDTDIHAQLSEDESKKVIEIFNGKHLYFGSPSCGFGEEVSLRINGKSYAPACDNCCIIKDCSSGMYFDISASEREIVEEYFAAYGVTFPCT